MIHVTCAAHGLHRIAEKVRDHFSTVEKVIANCKKVFKKAPTRVILMILLRSLLFFIIKSYNILLLLIYSSEELIFIILVLLHKQDQKVKKLKD